MVNENEGAEMRIFGGICIALSLAFLWACTEVEVHMPSHASTSIDQENRPPFEKPSISLAKFKEIQKKNQGTRGGLCAPNGPVTRDVKNEQQETSDWCWAATGKVVMRFHNEQFNKKTHDQCKIVSNSINPNLDRVTCCPSEVASSKSECLGGGWPSTVFTRYGFDYEVVTEALDWESLTNEICGTGPFLYVINFQGGGSHALVATGYTTANDTRGTDPSQRKNNLVLVYDPIYAPTEKKSLDYMTHQEFVGDADDPYGFTHDRDYAQISPLGQEQPR